MYEKFFKKRLINAKTLIKAKVIDYVGYFLI